MMGPFFKNYSVDDPNNFAYEVNSRVEYTLDDFEDD